MWRDDYSTNPACWGNVKVYPNAKDDNFDITWNHSNTSDYEIDDQDRTLIHVKEPGNFSALVEYGDCSETTQEVSVTLENLVITTGDTYFCEPLPDGANINLTGTGCCNLSEYRFTWEATSGNSDDLNHLTDQGAEHQILPQVDIDGTLKVEAKDIYFRIDDLVGDITYKVTMIDPYGCSVSKNIKFSSNIFEPELEVIKHVCRNEDGIIEECCYGELKLDSKLADGTYSVEWISPSGSSYRADINIDKILPTKPGRFQAKVTDNVSGCVAWSNEVEVQEYLYSHTIDKKDICRVGDQYCPGFVELKVTHEMCDLGNPGNYTILWQGPSYNSFPGSDDQDFEGEKDKFKVEVKNPGTYKVIFEPCMGCTIIEEIYVSESELTVTVNDKLPNPSTDVFEIGITPGAQSYDIKIEANGCSNLSSNYPNDYSYEWDKVVNLYNINTPSSPAGIHEPDVRFIPDPSIDYYEYKMIVTEKDQCSREVTIKIYIVEPEIVFHPEYAICLGGSVELLAYANPLLKPHFQWHPDDGLDNPFAEAPKASPLTTTEYYFDVYFDDGTSLKNQGPLLVMVLDESIGNFNKYYFARYTTTDDQSEGNAIPFNWGVEPRYLFKDPIPKAIDNPTEFDCGFLINANLINEDCFSMMGAHKNVVDCILEYNYYGNINKNHIIDYLYSLPDGIMRSKDNSGNRYWPDKRGENIIAILKNYTPTGYSGPFTDRFKYHDGYIATGVIDLMWDNSNEPDYHNIYLHRFDKDFSSINSKIITFGELQPNTYSSDHYEIKDLIRVKDNLNIIIVSVGSFNSRYVLYFDDDLNIDNSKSFKMNMNIDNIIRSNYGGFVIKSNNHIIGTDDFFNIIWNYRITKDSYDLLTEPQKTTANFAVWHHKCSSVLIENNKENDKSIYTGWLWDSDNDYQKLKILLAKSKYGLEKQKYSSLEINSEFNEEYSYTSHDVSIASIENILQLKNGNILITFNAYYTVPSEYTHSLSEKHWSSYLVEVTSDLKSIVSKRTIKPSNIITNIQNMPENYFCEDNKIIKGIYEVQDEGIIYCSYISNYLDDFRYDFINYNSSKSLKDNDCYDEADITLTNETDYISEFNDPISIIKSPIQDLYIQEFSLETPNEVEEYHNDLCSRPYQGCLCSDGELQLEAKNKTYQTDGTTGDKSCCYDIEISSNMVNCGYTNIRVSYFDAEGEYQSTTYPNTDVPDINFHGSAPVVIPMCIKGMNGKSTLTFSFIENDQINCTRELTVGCGCDCEDALESPELDLRYEKNGCCYDIYAMNNSDCASNSIKFNVGIDDNLSFSTLDIDFDLGSSTKWQIEDETSSKKSIILNDDEMILPGEEYFLTTICYNDPDIDKIPMKFELISKCDELIKTEYFTFDCKECCDYVSVRFETFSANLTECCWLPIVSVDNDILCGESDVDVTYTDLNGDPLQISGGLICLPQGQSMWIKYTTSIDGIPCESRNYELVCEGCPCEEDFDWIRIETDKDSFDCEPDKCKVTAYLDVPPEFSDCFTKFNYQYVIGNAPIGQLNDVVDYDPVEPLPLNGIINLGSICIDAGRTFLLRVTLFTEDESGSCTITGGAAGCPRIKIDNRGCDLEDPWDLMDKTIEITTDDGCSYIVHFNARKKDGYQDINIIGIEGEDGCMDKTRNTDVFQNSLALIISNLVKNNNWEPNNENPCSNIWRIFQATCWSKWGLGSSINGSEGVILVPCDDECCIGLLRVCNEDGHITISSIGTATYNNINHDCSQSGLPEAPTSDAILLEPCDDYNCSIFEGIGIEYDMPHERDDEYDRELGRGIIPRLPELNNEELRYDVNIKKIIYKSNYYDQTFELIILSSTFKKITLNIQNILGQDIVSNEYDLNGGFEQLKIDFANHAKGAYLFNIISNGRIVGFGKFLNIK
jgi:hypothetical protein